MDDEQTVRKERKKERKKRREDLTQAKGEQIKRRHGKNITNHEERAQLPGAGAQPPSSFAFVASLGLCTRLRTRSAPHPYVSFLSFFFPLPHTRPALILADCAQQVAPSQQKVNQSTYIRYRCRHRAGRGIDK